MAPMDDSELHAMLDALAVAPSAVPGQTAATSFSTPHPGLPTVTKQDLPQAIELANSLLDAEGLGARIPALQDSSANAAHDALAAALGMLIMFSRSRSALADIHAETERVLANVRRERDEAKETSSRARRSAAAKEADLAATRAARADDAKKARETERALKREATELRGKLAAVARREESLAGEARRRDKDYAKLQDRVHAMLTSRGVLTVAPSFVSPHYHTKAREDAEDEVDPQAYDQYVASAYEERLEVLTAENEECRELLLAVQVELDELLASEFLASKTGSPGNYSDSTSRTPTSRTPKTDTPLRRASLSQSPNVAASCTATPTPTAIADTNEYVKTNRSPRILTASPELSSSPSRESPIAPSNEQMQLPMSVFREDILSSLQQKFGMLRACFETR